jgi:hypothetical protein
MTSPKKIAANRINGRKGRGPRTAAGKSRASRNALRHGLTTLKRNATLLEEIKRIANLICQREQNPQLFEQALVIAENELLLRFARAERIAVIERLRDEKMVPLAKGDNRLALVKARFREARVAYPELVKVRALVEESFKAGRDQEFEELKEPFLSAWHPKRPEDRDEYEAMREAMRDLGRVFRYEQRAWSRRKRAVREFITIKLIGRVTI